MKIVFETDPQLWRKVFTADGERMATAATEAMREVGEIAQKAGRASIKAAGGRFGRGWQNALRLQVFPRNEVSLGATAFIYHKIPYAGVFERGAVIQGKPIMWVPLKSSPSTIGGRRMTPDQYRISVGPLTYVKRPGHPPLLVGRIASKTAKGRKVTNVNLSALRRGASEGGRSVPIFVGIEMARISKRFDVAGAVEQAARNLPLLYFKHLR
jgi:hypothetical protein